MATKAKKNPTQSSTRRNISVHTAECYYVMCCRHLNVSPDAAVLSTLKSNSDALRPLGSSYGDGHWLALCQLLLIPFLDSPHAVNFGTCGFLPGDCDLVRGLFDDDEKSFTHHSSSEMTPIKVLWFNDAKVAGSNRAVLLSKVISTNTFIVELHLERNMFNLESAFTLARALRINTTLKILDLHGNPIYEAGTIAIANALSENKRHGLEHLNMSHLGSGFKAVKALKEMERETNAIRERTNAPLLCVDAGMNFVVEEIANSITHGIGLGLAIAGLVCLLHRASYFSYHHTLNTLVFGLTLIATMASSCLFHGFFPLRRTSAIFQRFDHASIFLLIAGTYTPLINLNMCAWEWSPYLLMFIWTSAVCGLSLVCFAFERFPRAQLALYLLMGWSAVISFNKMLEFPTTMFWLIVGGGITYTTGVVFYVIGERIPIYHALWHVFVMGGACCHYFAIYFYSVGVPLPSACN